MIYLVSAGITAFLLVLITLFVAAIVKAKNRYSILLQVIAIIINSRKSELRTPSFCRQKRHQQQSSKIHSISGPLMGGGAANGGSVFVVDGSGLPDVTGGDVWKKGEGGLTTTDASCQPRSLIHDCGLPPVASR